MPPRRQCASFAGRCLRPLQRSARVAAASSEMRVVSCVEPRRSRTIGSVPREVRGEQERASDSFTQLTVSRRVGKGQKRRQSFTRHTGNSVQKWTNFGVFLYSATRQRTCWLVQRVQTIKCEMVQRVEGHAVE